MTSSHSPLSFEVRSTDLAGRICNLAARSSKIETPALMPVVHPVSQLIPCREIKAMGYGAVITNAYTAYKRIRESAHRGIHSIIDFDGMVTTDSGGYQMLEFGSVDIQPLEMLHFEETLRPDVAVILDTPTGYHVTKGFARKTVDETLKAAKHSMEQISEKEDIAWTIPIQGGKYVDLVARSAKYSAKLGYDVYALGSPVEVLEEYDFSLIVKMILAARKNIPRNRPFHLFGAGHPLILPLAVALGCDLFDSASYVLYAKQDRYISSSGTIRLEQIEYLSCPCKICSSLTAKELKRLSKSERTASLARHNLWALREVILQTKQAIWEGRLWEYVRAKSANHPRVAEAFRTAVESDREGFEEGTPTFKQRGIFVFDPVDLSRPEIERYHSQLTRINIRNRSELVILPETKTKPFLNSRLFKEVSKLVKAENTMISFLCPNLGLVPAEISDVFPLSQIMSTTDASFPEHDSLLGSKDWERIHVLIAGENSGALGRWVSERLVQHSNKLAGRRRIKGKRKPEILVSKSYKSFKLATRKLLS